MPNRVIPLNPGIEKLAPEVLADLLTETANHIRDVLNDGGAVDIAAIHDWLKVAHEAAGQQSEQRYLLTIALTFLEAGFPPETD